MTRAVLPYFVASRNAVDHSGWQFLEGDDWIALPDALPDWDYNTDLRVRVALTIHAADFEASTHLPPTAELQWVFSWRSIDGRVGDTAHRHRLDSPLKNHDGEPKHFELHLPGMQLGPEIELRTTLVLAAAVPFPPLGAAQHPGSMLWGHTHRLSLVGDLARFPVSVTDFESAGLDPDASFVLDLADDLSTPTLGGLLLLLNERDKSLVTAVQRDPQGVLASQLTETVAVQMLDHAVHHADELLADDWEVGSLGASLRMLGARAEGGLPRLSRMRLEQPMAYRATLVGLARRSGLGRAL